MSESTLSTIEGITVLLLVVAYALTLTIERLQRTRPDLRIGAPILAGVAVRLAAVVGIANSGLQTQLRGGDEQTFITFARVIADSPWGHGFLPHGPYKLHTIVFAAQIKLANIDVDSLRITQIGIATLGVVLITAAVHDLAGPRQARLAAWLIAFEPASIFFGGALHKEPLMTLASGLVVFGGSKLWRNLDPLGALLCALGCVIAIETRSYAGWFLVSASVLVLLHAAVKRLPRRPGRAIAVIYAVVFAGFLIAPTLTRVTSNESLKQLQASQTANATGAGQGAKGTANASNLALEKVDFSTRSKVIRNLPQRMYDVAFRPYPWQLENASQRLGALGTLISTATLLALVRYAWRRRRTAMAVVAPVFYPFLLLLFAYALSAGNAGTGFRYRAHLVTLALAMVAMLREQREPSAVARRSTRAARAPAFGPIALDSIRGRGRARA